MRIDHSKWLYTLAYSFDPPHELPAQGSEATMREILGRLAVAGGIWVLILIVGPFVWAAGLKKKKDVHK